MEVQQHAHDQLVIVFGRDDVERQRGLLAHVDRIHERAGLQQHVHGRRALARVHIGRGVVQRVVAAEVRVLEQLGLLLQQLLHAQHVALARRIVQRRAAVLGVDLDLDLLGHRRVGLGRDRDLVAAVDIPCRASTRAREVLDAKRFVLDARRRVGARRARVAGG